MVAERVREVRDGMVPKLSAAGLAERCAALGMPELNRDVIANIESGRRRSVTVDEVFVLAAALGVSPGYLLGMDDDAVGDGFVVRRVGTAVEVDTALPVTVVRSGAAVGAVTADAAAAAPAPTVSAAAEDE